jgi:hypothetical protein
VWKPRKQKTVKKLSIFTWMKMLNLVTVTN